MSLLEERVHAEKPLEVSGKIIQDTKIQPEHQNDLSAKASVQQSPQHPPVKAPAAPLVQPRQPTTTQLETTSSHPATTSSWGGKLELVNDQDEPQSQLTLAKAYVDVGDADSARELLIHVIAHGNDAQKKEAQDLLEKLSK
jgi:pilus assembly protein FimV